MGDVGNLVRIEYPQVMDENGELSGSCSACIGYSLSRGATVTEAKCKTCAEAGYKVEVKFLYDWVTYSHHQIFAKGCIGLGLPLV